MGSKITVFTLFTIILFSCKKHEEDPALNLVQGLPKLAGDHTPGFAMHIYSWDSLVLSKYQGVEVINTDSHITSKTLFNVGSISKTFVAYGILLLAQDGKISLTDSIIKFFPDFKNKELGQKVKIYHLLTHSSGLPDNRHPYQDSVFYLTADDAQNWTPILQNDSLEFEPGSKFTYSNPAFNALALIIQQVTGLKWQDYIKIKIFTPSQMKTSTITDGKHPETGVSHAYILNGNSWSELDYGEEPTFNAAGNGGVWSSADELFLYENAIQKHAFADGEVISQSRTIYPLQNWQDSIPSWMGLSWFISKQNDHMMYSHTGSQGGFTADFVSIPSAGFFYCIVSNVPLEIMSTRKKVLEYAGEKGWIK